MEKEVKKMRKTDLVWCVEEGTGQLSVRHYLEYQSYPLVGVHVWEIRLIWCRKCNGKVSRVGLRVTCSALYPTWVLIVCENSLRSDLQGLNDRGE